MSAPLLAFLYRLRTAKEVRKTILEFKLKLRTQKVGSHA